MHRWVPQSKWRKKKMEKLDNLIKSSVLFMDGMWACDVTFHQDSIQALYSQLESQPTSLPIKINVHVYNKKRQLNSTQVDFLPGFYIKTKRLTLSTSPKSILLKILWFILPSHHSPIRILVQILAHWLTSKLWGAMSLRLFMRSNWITRHLIYCTTPKQLKQQMRGICSIE